MDTDLKRVVGQGTKQKWEGEAPAEPETTVNGDWRLVNDFSGGQCSRTVENFGADNRTLNSALRTDFMVRPLNAE